MKYLLCFLLILLASTANATLTLDATSSTTGTTQNLSWTHTAVAIPEGVLVVVTQLVAAAGAQDEVTSITYGGITMLELTGSPKFCAGGTGDSGTLHAFYLQNSIPSGLTQTVAVNGSVARSKGAGCYTFNSTIGTISFNDIDVTLCQTSGANPSVNLQLNSIASFICMVFGSGQAAVSGITPLAAPWTGLFEIDHGNCTGGSYYKTSIAATDTVAKWTALTDDGYMIAIAVKDSAPVFGRAGTEALDNRLRQQFPTTNYGAGAADTLSTFGGLRAGGAAYNYICSFPGLGASLSGSTVDSAKLTLRMLANSLPTSDTYGFSAVRPGQSDWSETQSTWRLKKTGTDWADSGASSTTTDIFATSYSEFTEAAYTDNADNIFSVTALCKGIDGADTTSTFTIRSVGGDGTALGFNSANCATAARRPKLQVWKHNGIDVVAASGSRNRRTANSRNQ
jgi:hypothetical protein